MFAPVSVCAQPLMGGRAAPPPRGGLGRCSRLCRYLPSPLWGAGLPRPPVGGWGDICAHSRGSALGLRALLVSGVGLGCVYGLNESRCQLEGVLGFFKSD